MERLSPAPPWCLRRKAGGECAHLTSTPRRTETFASTSPWVRKVRHQQRSETFDLSRVKKMKFVSSGGGECDPGESHENDVIVYGRSEGRRERVVLDTLPYSSYRVRRTDKTHKP